MDGGLELICGTLGGGKSLTAAERIYKHLLRGGCVYTNIQMYPEKVAEHMRERDSRVFVPERLIQLDGSNLSGFHNQVKRGTRKSRVLIVIDECHLEWNARDYQKTNKDSQKREMLNFVTLVRKLDIDLVLITQDSTDIDKQLRKKGSVLTVCRNLKKMRIFGVIPFPLPLFTRVQFDVSIGHSKPVRIGCKVYRFPVWVGEIYNTDALLGNVAGIFEALEVAESGKLQKTNVVSSRKLDDILEIVLGLVFGFW